MVAGWANTSAGHQFALARYTPNGSLDTSFDTDGKLFTAFDGGYAGASAMALQADGKIVAAGWAGTSARDRQFALARYTPNGSLDTSFHDDGKRLTNFDTPSEVARAIAIQSTGEIVVAGGGGSYLQE